MIKILLTSRREKKVPEYMFMKVGKKWLKRLVLKAVQCSYHGFDTLNYADVVKQQTQRKKDSNKCPV